jgi:hypothetical protein
MGNPTQPSQILIDGEPASSHEALRSLIEQIGVRKRRFELLVSHIDTDHIDGVFLLQDGLGISFEDVWFNAWPQFAGLGGKPLPTYLQPIKASFSARCCKISIGPGSGRLGTLDGGRNVTSSLLPGVGGTQSTERALHIRNVFHPADVYVLGGHQFHDRP